MTRSLAILMALILAACATSPERALRTDASTLVKASGSIKSYSEFVQQIRAFKDLMERQREFSRQAGCMREKTLSFDCMTQTQQESYLEANPDAPENVWIHGAEIKLADLIINNQQSNDDEDLLFKKSGNFLFALEEATLHSMRIEHDGKPVLEHVSSVPLAVNSTHSEVWFDELIVVGRQLLVLGFNNDIGVAELHSYRIDQQGRLERNASYWLRGDEHFSSSNFVARIQNGKLVTRMSVEVDIEKQSVDFQWPEWSRRDVANPTWNLLVKIRNPSFARGPLDEYMGIHVVSQCELDALARGAFDCRSQAVVGPLAASFYVSPTAAYLCFIHMSPEAFGNPQFDLSYGGPKWARNGPNVARTTIARLDLLGSQPPQFAQIEGRVDDSLALSERNQTLFVVSKHFSWRNDTTIPMVNKIQPSDWSLSRARLIRPTITVQNFRRLDSYRFTEDAVWLCERKGSTAHASMALHRLSLTGEVTKRFPIAHSAVLLQPIPAGMLVIGDKRDGMAATVLLDKPSKSVRIRHVWPRRAVADSRSQAVNLQIQSDGRVLLGWPSNGALRDEQFYDQPSDLQFIEFWQEQIRDVGVVNMQDICPTTDEREIGWYGDARIAFVGGRIFTFSRHLVKETIYQNGELAITRRLMLQKPSSIF